MTAINDTGQHDAQKANDAVECFVRYLRSNVDVLQNDKLILFEQELAHFHKKHFPNEKFSYIMKYSGLEICVMVRSMQNR